MLHKSLFTKWVLILGLILFPSIVKAQTQTITTTTCPGAGCADYSVSGQGTIAVQLTGTWSGTVTFRGSIDGSTFVSLVVTSVADTTATKATTTTANGTFQASVAGLSTVRVVFTSFSSGTATVNARTTVAASRGVGAGGGGSGTVNTSSPITGDGSVGSPVTCATCGTGTIGGSIASTQVGFGSGTNTIGGDSTLLFDSTNKQFTVGIKEDNASFNSYIQDWWGNFGQVNLGQVYAGAGNQTAAITVVEESSTTDVQTLQILGASSKDDGVTQGLNIDSVYIGGAAKTGGVAQGIVVAAGNSNNGGALTEATGIHIVSPIGTTITNAYGLRINNQTKAGTTLNFAIDVNGKFRVDPDGSGVALGSGGALKTDTTTAHTALLQAYDVDGTAYKTFATLTNGNVPDFSLAAPSGGTLGVSATSFATQGTTAVAVANVGANSCGTTAASIAGNDTVGEITVGATAGTQCRVTFTVAAAARRDCVATDETTTIATRATYVNSTHSDFLGAFVAGDVVTYVCIAR